MTTLLQQLELDIDRAAFAQIADVLFNRELTRHTRRGHRECDCEYCIAKKHATVDVAFATQNLKYPRQLEVHPDRPVRWWGCGVRYTDEWLLKEMARDRVRREVRKQLRELVEKD